MKTHAWNHRMGVALALLAALGTSTPVGAQEAPIDAISAAVERVSAGARVTLIVSVTDANGKPVEAFVRAFDHIGPPPAQPIGTPRGSFEVNAWLCETFDFDGRPDATACGWVPFKVDGAIAVLKSSDQGSPLQQPSVYRVTVVPNGVQIGTKDFSTPGSHVSFLVRARVTRLSPSSVLGEPFQLAVLSQREVVAVWRTPPPR